MSPRVGVAIAVAIALAAAQLALWEPVDTGPPAHRAPPAGAPVSPPAR